MSESCLHKGQGVDIPSEQVCVPVADGYRAVGRLFECEQAARAVVYLHGIQSHGGWFLRSCDSLRQGGVTVLQVDRRGSGLNDIDRGHCQSAEQLLADLDCCVDWLMSRSGLQAIDIVAVSWSGKLALVYAGRHPEKVGSVVLVAPGLRARVDISLKEKIMIGAHGLLDPHRLHEIPLNDAALFTANPAMLRFIEQDPLKLTHATASFFVASHRLDMMVPKVLDKLSMPVHLFLAERDRIIDNDATTKLLQPVLQSEAGICELQSEPDTPEMQSQCGTPARLKMYAAAEHTLEFESNAEPFMADLLAAVRP